MFCAGTVRKIHSLGLAGNGYNYIDMTRTQSHGRMLYQARIPRMGLFTYKIMLYDLSCRYNKLRLRTCISV